MRYEITFLDDAMKNTVVVDAEVGQPDTAIFLAGMRFSEMDINTERIEVVSVEEI